MEQLTCVIPGLIVDFKDIPLASYKRQMDIVNIEKLLARSRVKKLTRTGSVGLFSHLLNLEGAELAEAPIARLGEGAQADSQWWLRLDPVYFQADRDNVLMMGNECLDISLDEAQALALELSHHFSDLDWHLEVLHPKRWYLSLPEPPEIETYDLRDVQGKHIFDFLPYGPQGRQWHGLLNEMQMLLHASSINSARVSQGKLPINALWLWGGGRLPEIQRQAYRCYGGGVYEQGMAKLAGMAAESEMTDYETLKLSEEGSHGAIVFLDELQQALMAQNLDQWVHALNHLEQHWLAPIRADLRNKRLNKLTLFAGDSYLFESNNKDQKRFWMRRQSLLDYAAQYAER